MNKNARICFVSSLAALAVIILVSPVMAQQQPQKKLKGGVNQDDYQNKSAPSLSRTDIRDSGGDPFGNDGAPDGTMGDFDPPPEVFQQAPLRRMPPPPKQQPTFGGPQQSLEDALDGLEMEMPPAQMKGRLQDQKLQPLNGNLKQDSPEMDIAWNEWHKRVAQAVYIRFNNMAKMAFPQSRPLSCQITYTVTRDGQIVNCRSLQGSGDRTFDSMVLQVVASLNGSALLQFPQGSRRQQVEKLAGFEHNFGDPKGFKYQYDNEHVKGK